MKLKVNDIYVDPIRVRDRIEFRFDSEYDLDYVTLKGSDILGDIQLSEIQLEQSTVSTPFVEPMESETVATGLFKSVQGISYEITSPDSDTWAQIKQSVEGSITTYHNGPLQSTLALTVNDVIFGIRDIVSGDQASFNLRLEGIQQVVKDEMFESVQTQLSNFVGIELQDIEGNINTIQNTVDGSVQQISNLEGSFNTIQDTVDGSIQRIGNVEGDLSIVQSTASSNTQALSSLSGQYNTTKNTVNSMSQAIGTKGEKVAQLVMNDSLFKVDVIDEIKGAKSSVNVLSDSIGLRSSGNTIYIGGEGIFIDAESIFIGRSTQIKDGLITDSMISSRARIDAAKIANLTVDNAQIVSLDVSKLSGNTSDFVRTAWNGISSRMSADSSGLKINTTNGWDMYLGNSGVTFTSKQGAVTGALRATRTGNGDEAEGTFLIAERKYLSGLGRRLSNGNLRGSLYVDGETGSISVASDIGSNSEIRAPEYHIGQYNRLVRYVGSESKTAAFEHRSSIHNDYNYSTDRIWLVRNSDTMTMYANLNMNGKTIANQSDIRLKKNITDSGVNALKEIERLNFVNFEWDETKGQDLKPKGVQFGIIAQHSPFLQMKTDDEESYLSIDMSKQVNLNSKASQELLAYTRSLEKRIEVLEGGGQ